MDKIAILIPCYNEEMGILNVIQDVKKYLPEATIYVYDNNSTDKTVEIASKAGALIRYEKKQGKGNVVKTMFKEIDAECYIMVDGDDTYDLKSLKEMARRILEDKDDMVIGDRLNGSYFKENKRMLHGFGNKIVKASVNCLFGSKNPDIMTGLRAFSYTFIKSFPSSTTGFEIETEMSIFATLNNFKMSSIVIEFKDRPEGSFSKVNTIKDGVKIMNFIFKLFVKNKPLALFIPLAVIFLGLGIGLLIPTYLNLNQSLFFILSIVFLVIGFINLLVGLILNHRKNIKNKAVKENIKSIKEEYLNKINNKTE